MSKKYVIASKEKYSAVSRRRALKIPKEERVKRMRKLAIIKQLRMSASEKRKHALKMVRARKNLIK